MDTYIPTDDGQWVSENYERLARVIQDYDHNLQLCWIPPDKRTREDKEPYCIVDNTHGNDYIVLYASELDSPTDILTKLFMADNKQGNVLTRLEAMNNAQELLNQKKRLDELEEMMEKAEFLKTTPLHYIKMGRDDEGKLIKMDDTRRRI